MHASLSILLLCLCAAPEDDAPARPAAEPSPKAVVEELAAAVRSGDLLDVYDRLTPAGQRRLEPLAARVAPSVGLDAAKATTREIVAALEKMLKMEGNAQLPVLAQLTVTVGKVERTGDDTAKVIVRGELLGRSEAAVLTMARENGQWKLDDVAKHMDARTRREANETAAIATLRNLAAAQAQFQAVGVADVNRNGVGEYGFFGELSGAVGIRGGDRKLNPPVLSSVFREVENGTVTRAGYHFRIFLAGAAGAGVSEADGVKRVDAAGAETLWCCYAWPVKQGETGSRTFFINQFGDVLATDHDGYGGAEGPSAPAAFQPAAEGAAPPTLASVVALNADGHDGHAWKRIG